MRPAPLLRVRGLRAGYGGGEVLHGVDLDVAEGALVAVLGPNGAGKSTLLNAVAGRVRPWAGRVELAGVNVTGRDPAIVARCGAYVLPEGRAVFPSLTVRENLRMASGCPERVLAPRIDRVVTVFPRLAQRLHQLAGTLSGGEQRMLALGRALAAEPRLLLLDEPSLGLAPKVVDDVFDAIGRFRALGTSVVLVEQYVHRALAVADDVVILAKGRVAWQGGAGDLEEADLVNRYLGGAPAA